MSRTVEEAVIRKSVRVRVSIECAFSVFVEQMENWWPATHRIGKTSFEPVFVEPRIGGRWYVRDVDGNLCDWGTVLAWDPPNRVTLLWHLGPGHDQPDWKFDPDMAKASEVEIRFTAEGPGTTLVELEHTNLERHGEGYEHLRAVFDGPGAWRDILALYAKATHGDLS